MLRKFVAVLGTAGVLMLFSALLAGSAGDQVPFPHGFRDWFFVNSLSVTADSPLFARMAGLHHIYVNARGLPILKAGGPFPYPDETIFADDVHEFSVKDGATLEGAKTFVTVMVMDAKKYPTTGGDSKCGLRAIPRNHKYRILPTRSKLALFAIHLKKLKTTRFPATFPEISNTFTYWQSVAWPSHYRSNPEGRTVVGAIRVSGGLGEQDQVVAEAAARASSVDATVRKALATSDLAIGQPYDAEADLYASACMSCYYNTGQPPFPPDRNWRSIAH
jgi:hypothetical protein